MAPCTQQVLVLATHSKMRLGRARGSLSAAEKHLQGNSSSTTTTVTTDRWTSCEDGGNKGGDAMVDDEGVGKQVGMGGRRQR